LHISTIIRDSGKCNPMKYGKNSCRRCLHKWQSVIISSQSFYAQNNATYVRKTESSRYYINCLTPRVGPGHSLSPLSIPFLVFCSFLLFLFLSGFNYFLLLSIPYLYTRIVPLRFQVGGRRKRPNMGLVCSFYFVLSVFLS